MKRRILAFAVVQLFSGVPGAGAQTFVAAPQQNFTFEVSARSGYYDEWSHNDLGPLTALKATISLDDETGGKIERWQPKFRLVLENKMAVAEAVYVLYFSSDTGKPPFSIYLVNGKETKTFSRRIAYDEKLDIEVFWSGGKLIARLNGSELQTLSMTSQITSLTITASTGGIKFSPLVLGNSK